LKSRGKRNGNLKGQCSRHI